MTPPLQHGTSCNTAPAAEHSAWERQTADDTAADATAARSNGTFPQSTVHV